MAKTFFYERKDGTVFACEEKEASLMRSVYKLIGTSDGKAFDEGFKKIFAELQQKTRDLLNKRDSTTMTTADFDEQKNIINEEYKTKYDKLFKEELEIAKQRPVPPKDFSKDFSNIPSHILARTKLLR